MIYTTGTISVSGNTLTGTGTNFTAAGSLIRVGCTVITMTSPPQVFQITGITSGTAMTVSPAASPALAAGTKYSILLSDSLSVDGLAQDIAETFKMYQSNISGFADVMNGTGDVTITINGAPVTVPGQKSLAKKGANKDITSLTGLTTALSVSQGGTGRTKDLTPAELRTNAGLGTAAEANVGTDVGNIPAIVQRDHGRHVSSMYMSALSLATIAPGANEYMIAAVEPGADGINAVGLIGRFTYSRGGLTSNNMPGIVDVMIQASYKGLGATMGIRYPIAGARNLFIGTATATYKGRKVYLLKLPASGGPFNNGVFFDGLVFRTNDTNDIFSVVKAEELTDLVDLTNDPTISYPISSTSSRKVGTDVNDIPYVGAFGVGNGTLNRPTAHVNQFISETVNPSTWTPNNGVGMQMSYANQRTAQIFINSAKEMYFRWNGSLPPMALNTEIPWIKIYTDQNTTKASDGSIKAASPVARIANPDSTIRSDIDEASFEWCGYGVANGEARGIEIIRDDIGVYRVTGAKSLASSGWRLEPPKDPDGKGELGTVAAEQRGDEIIITLHRRKMVLENGEIVVKSGEPIDVPANSWIDVRLDMPEVATPPEAESPVENEEPQVQPE